MRLFFRCSAFFSALPARVALLPGVDMRPTKSYRCVCTSEDFMANDSHQRAAEFHELAAHAHRVAAMHHGKEDHQTGHEHARQAMEHAAKAFQKSQEALQQSAMFAGGQGTKKN
jgi:hypothetical protein